MSISPRHVLRALTPALLAIPLLAAQPVSAEDQWTHWRGPLQTGVALERYTDWSFNEEPVWTDEVRGRGTPVVFKGRLFSFSYTGTGEDVYEQLTAYDAATGEIVWRHEIRDFISDTIYNRYAIGAPVVDPETGHVYLLTAYGIAVAYTFDGELLWEKSLMEQLGRLTFPNGRVGSPVIEGELVILRGITANWGAEGPAADRFYGVDKLTGELVWSSTPGTIPPVDSSFSHLYTETREGRRVGYAATGCGHLVALNIRNGQPLWRFPFSRNGVNASPIIYNDTFISIHSEENIDEATHGRMAAIALPKTLEADELPQTLTIESSEVWRNTLGAPSSSPVLVGDTVYQVTRTGQLASVNAATGEVNWQEKLGSSNLHSSPIYADGLIYLPLSDGHLFVIRPTEEKAEILHKVKLEGECLGAPALSDGWLYVHTTEHLYAFKLDFSAMEKDPAPTVEIPEAGEPASLRIVPAEVALAPGQSIQLAAHPVDRHGFVTGPPVEEAGWTSYIPPTARVQSTLNAEVDASGLMTATDEQVPSAGAFRAVAGDLSGTMRGRVLPVPPLFEDFTRFELNEEDENGAFAFPPLSWIGARFKFDVREMDGTQLLAKNMDRLLFQRSTAFISNHELNDYILQADVMTDGNRRAKSDVGLINQRYLFSLKGNWNKLEVSSNYERLTRDVDFPVQANTWYTLKTHVQRNEDGSGVVRAKAWPRGEDEPEAWTLEVELDYVHPRGAPGIYAFTAQNQHKVYLDNIKLTQDEE